MASNIIYYCIILAVFRRVKKIMKIENDKE